MKLAELAGSKGFVIWDLWEPRNWYYDTKTSKWIFTGVLNCHDKVVNRFELMPLFKFKSVKVPTKKINCMIMMTMLFSLAFFCGAIDRTWDLPGPDSNLEMGFNFSIGDLLQQTRVKWE